MPEPGRLVAIFVAPTAGAPMVRVPEAEALAGAGLAGDRYAAGEGAYSRWPGRGREVTLIAAEALAEAEAAFDVRLGDGAHRRNLVVVGVPLAAWVGQRVRVGEVLVEGVRVCAPCRYLVRVSGQAEIFDALVRRGGLRAEIVEGGTLREGDPVVPVGTPRRRSLPG